MKKYVILGIVAIAITKIIYLDSYYTDYVNQFTTLIVVYGLSWGGFSIWGKMDNEQKKSTLSVFGVLLFLAIMRMLF